MKNSIPAYFLKPLLFFIPLDILLIILRWFTPLNFAVTSPNIGMRILGLLITMALLPINFIVLMAIGGIFFERWEKKTHERELADGTIINIEGIGEFLFREWSPNCYSKTETLALFGKEYKVTIRMETGLKGNPITDAQIKAYYEFIENYATYQAELEDVLRTQEYDEIFKMVDIIFNANGNYKMIASDTTPNNSGYDFVVTFHPIDITFRPIDFNGNYIRYH